MLENKPKHSRYYSSFSSATVLGNHTGFINSAILLKTCKKIKKPQKACFSHVKFNIPIFLNREKNGVLYKTVKICPI